MGKELIVTKAQIMGEEVEVINDEDDAIDLKTAVLEKTISDQKRLIRKLKKKVVSGHELLSEISGEFKQISPYINNYRFRSANSKPMAEFVLQLGDWHIGEVIDKAISGDGNEYNFNIAKTRIFSIVNQIMRYIKMHRSRYCINTCHIFDLGDNISGDIHDELTITNEFPVPKQVVNATLLKAEVFRRLASIFKEVKVTWVSTDNHARLTKKPPTKQAGENSHNYIIGFFTAKLLKDVDNIKFNLVKAHQAKASVLHMNYCMEHGNTIRGGFAGIPWYGVDKKVKSISQSSHKVVKLLIQHFHTPFHCESFNVGGSLSGTSELDYQQSRHSSPCQIGWMVDSSGEFNWTKFPGTI